jgi:threonine dehydratase
MSLIDLDAIRAAQGRVAGTAVRTSLIKLDAARLRAAGVTEPGFAIYIKDESAQPIGSFKLRGAYNRIARLAEEDPVALGRGVITYSSGNHAQGVAYAARELGTKAVIVMPDNAPVVKIEATRALGAEVVSVGPASSERRRKAEELAAAHGYTVIPPYDDPGIIAGAATCGVEILEQVAEAAGDAVKDDLLVLSPVSGGGLLSGTATGIKLISPGTKVWGVEPELSADAKESFETRTLVEWPAGKTTRTIADGLRTQSLGELNFEHIVEYVDGIVTVSEEQILAAMRVLMSSTTLVAEPSGAVTLAAALYCADQLPKVGTVVVILSGGNLEAALRDRLEGEMAAAR